jgi:SAM-dependent methyltransferase
MQVLDAGCGTGRHSVLLDSAGFKVTGVDISGEMLRVARQKSSDVEWVEGDMTEWSRPEAFDAAISICQGGLGLADFDQNPLAHDYSILRNLAASVKPGGKILLTALNGYGLIRRLEDGFIEQGSFNPATMEFAYADEWELPEGNTPMLIRERLMIPPELIAMMNASGMRVSALYGGTAGEWGERALKLDEIEMLVIAERPA